MKICNTHCIKLLKQFLSEIEGRSSHRALDVAGGDGRLAKNLLVGAYDRVDLFDRCPKAV